MTQISRKIMTQCLKVLICVVCVNLRLASAQTPEILKIDPPSWWPSSSMNPIRLLIHGRNLQDARVEVEGLRITSTPKINDGGTYIFVDVFIPPNARAGQRVLTVSTP